MMEGGDVVDRYRCGCGLCRLFGRALDRLRAWYGGAEVIVRSIISAYAFWGMVALVVWWIWG